MMNRRHVLRCAPALALLGGCASLSGRDPLRVQLAGLEPLDSEALELRFLCRLRVQNPNDTPIEYSGLSVEMWVHGQSFASGVSDAAGTVPRFGESVLALPVTVSAVSLARLAIGLFMGTEPRQLDYLLKGKLGGPAFGVLRFESRGQFRLPGLDDPASGGDRP